MTLVVARIIGNRVAVASDTLITEHDKQLPFQKGVVKSCMLPGNICVSFTNSPDTAARAFQIFMKQYPRGTGFADVISFFQRSSEETGNDYLVAFSSPARLIKIVCGERLDSVSKTLWIGDADAYTRFREFEARKTRRPEQGRAINAVLFADELEELPASDLYSAMRNVVRDTSIPTVGGFVSVVSNRDNGFRFSAYSDMLFDWPELKPSDYDLVLTDQISFTASGENADYSVAQISPGYMGLNLVAYYFVKAKKLFLFYGENFGLANCCQVFSNVSANAIKDTLDSFARYDFRWLLMITSPRHAGPYIHNMTGIEKPGCQLAFFAEANTFPKPNVQEQ